MIKEGILNFYKPSGIGSTDCIYMMRRATGIKKIGHTGTLDPMAEGVLPLCIGSSSRITEYLDLDFKTYVCTMELGWVTDTLDATGKTESDVRQFLSISEQKDKIYVPNDVVKGIEAAASEKLIGEAAKTETEIITRDDIFSAVSSFSDYVEQIPPKYSAVWVGGRRLYDYARAGAEVEIPKRRIFVKKMELLDIKLEYKPFNAEIKFRVCCSKGTYIRSICRDIGEILGIGGTMTALVRSESGVFKAENSVNEAVLSELSNLQKDIRVLETELGIYVPKKSDKNFGYVTPVLSDVERNERLKNLDDLRKIQEDKLNSMLMDPDEALTHFGKVVTSEKLGRDFCNGWHLSLKDCRIEKEPEYKNYNGILNIKAEYKKAYNVYMEKNGSEVFLGVAFYNNKYRKLVADKVFYKQFAAAKCEKQD